MNRHEAYGGWVVFLFGAATTVLSLRMPIGNLRAAGPGLFPLCLGVLLMILSGVLLLKVLLETGKDRRTAESGPETAFSAAQVLCFLGAMVLTILLLQPLGYPCSSFLLLLFLLRTLGLRAWRWNVLLSLTAALVSYLLFVQWLKIPLPKGWLGL